MEIYITFGQTHTHRLNGVTFDKDSVARINCNSYKEGRDTVFELFGDRFFTSYTKEQIENNFIFI